VDRAAVSQSMKRIAILLVGMAPWTLAQPAATVQGVVTNSVTHAGIGGVAVTLWTQQAVRYNATTDDSGAWQIVGVKPGRYYSRYDKSGFVEPPHEGPLGGAPLPVGAGGNPIQLNATLDPLATLRGRVLDPEGKPAAGVEVGINSFVSVKTDGEGQFVLTGVRPGTYTLVARPKPDETNQRTQTVATYYPSVTDRAQAAAVVVRGGDDLPGFDIRQRTSPVYRVRGVVLDENGKPLQRATVKLISKSTESTLSGQMTFGTAAGSVRYYFGSPGLETEEASAVSGTDGGFEFPSVPPGEWQMRAESEPKRDSRQNVTLNWSATIPATVTDHDLDDLQIRFPATFTLEAAVDWGDQPPPEASRRNLPIALLLIPADATGPTVPRFPSGTGELSRFENVAAGRYRLVPMPGILPGYYPSAVLLEGRDVLGQLVDLSPGIPPLRIVYKPQAGTIRGTVENGVGATVLLWPQSDSTLDLVRAVQAGPGGAFEFGTLAPDTYDVLAIDRQDLERQPESVIRSFPSSATAVQVDASGSPSIALPLTHLGE
jgi:hypothetical protein